MSETKKEDVTKLSEDVTKLSMIHLELDDAREMWYLGDITTLTKEITKSADFIETLNPDKRRINPLTKKKETGNPLTELKIKKLNKMPRRMTKDLKDKLIDLLPVWLEDEKLPEKSPERMESKFTNFETMVTNFDQKKNKVTKVTYGVFYVPIDQNKDFFNGENINARSVATLFFDDETYKNNDTNEKRSRYLLILKDIFNIPGQKFSGAKFLFKQAMDKMMENDTKNVTQVATAPFSGYKLDGEYDTLLQNRRATFTKWGFKHIKSEPEYYGLQKFQSIPEYGLPVQTTAKQIRDKSVVWGLMDYNFENVTRVKVDGNTYKIGGKSFDNVIDALEYEKETVSLLSQGLKLENSSGEKDENKHKKLVTDTRRYLDWLHSVKNNKTRRNNFKNDKEAQEGYNDFKAKPTVSDIDAIAKKHYYKQWLYKQLLTRKPDEEKFLFKRYVNYIFEIPLKQSYNESLQRGEVKRKSTVQLYQKYKDDVLYVSTETLEVFKKYDNTSIVDKLDGNELTNFIDGNWRKKANAFFLTDRYDRDKDNELSKGEFENLYQDGKFQKKLKPTKLNPMI